MPSTRLKGTVAEREIFSALVAQDGRMGDMDQNARNNFCKEIYKNTTQFMLGRGILMPVKLGHDDRDESLKGYVMSLQLRRRNYASVGLKGNKWFYSIYAKLFLRNDLFEKYGEGEFPSCSVELAESGYLPDGTEFGTHLSAVALLGTTPPALPLLEMGATNGLFFTKLNKINYVVFGVDSPEAAMGAQKMDPGKFKDELKKRFEMFVDSLYDELMGVEEGEPEEEVVIAEAAAGGAGGDEKPKEEPKEMASSPAAEELSAAAKELTALRRERAELQFGALNAKGHVSTDQKADFMKIAEVQGVEFAVQVYSKKSVPTPPAGERTGSADNRPRLTEEDAAILQYAERFGLQKKSLAYQALNGVKK